MVGHEITQGDAAHLLPLSYEAPSSCPILQSTTSLAHLSLSTRSLCYCEARVTPSTGSYTVLASSVILRFRCSGSHTHRAGALSLLWALEELESIALLYLGQSKNTFLGLSLPICAPYLTVLIIGGSMSLLYAIQDSIQKLELYSALCFLWGLLWHLGEVVS